MVEPGALIATLAGGAVSLSAIGLLRPRREQTLSRRSQRRAHTHVSDNPRQRVPDSHGSEDVSAGDTLVTPDYGGVSGSVDSIVREIAHSLNTPLAQIEATILAINPESKDQRAKISEMLDAARICKSFLSAFREIATVSGDAEAWEPDSVSRSLKAAADVYADRTGKTFDLKVNAPDRIPGYDNNYIIAIMLPVLENAIEAVESSGVVEVEILIGRDANIISVSNDTSLASLPERIYEPEFTTKPGHWGYGLAVVRRLVSARPNADVRHDLRDGRVFCIISLPRRP